MTTASIEIRANAKRQTTVATITTSRPNQLLEASRDDFLLLIAVGYEVRIKPIIVQAFSATIRRKSGHIRPNSET
tara:strand:+ start:254 stop:478 length:225 start_codon:yes stop_codon:yes gene_type:complete